MLTPYGLLGVLTNAQHVSIDGQKDDRIICQTTWVQRGPRSGVTDSSLSLDALTGCERMILEESKIRSKMFVRFRTISSGSECERVRRVRKS